MKRRSSAASSIRARSSLASDGVRMSDPPGSTQTGWFSRQRAVRSTTPAASALPTGPSSATTATAIASAVSRMPGSLWQADGPQRLLLRRVDAPPHDLAVAHAPDPAGRPVDDRAAPARVDAAERHDAVAEVAVLARVDAQLLPDAADVV